MELQGVLLLVFYIRILACRGGEVVDACFNTVHASWRTGVKLRHKLFECM